MLSDISLNWVFQFTYKVIEGEWTFNANILNVLYELDGKSTLFEISQKLKIDDDKIKKIIYYLYNLKLIELVKNNENDGNKLNVVFFDFLYDEFRNVVGPVAAVMIDDALEDMGFDQTSFPKNRASELIQKLIIECNDSPDRKEFIKLVMEKIITGDR